jgi:hypothetical protein
MVWLAISFVTPLHISRFCSPLPRHPRRNARMLSRARGLGWIRFRSPLLTESRLIFLPRATKMFQFTHLPHTSYGLACVSSGMTLKGFPHSDISGSKDVCSYPKLFAAYHVLHRLFAPRHPPCALCSLTIICPSYIDGINWFHKKKRIH